MEIFNINSQTNQVVNSRRQPGNDSLGKDAFLQLLVTQLGNQDPMNPMKSEEFASQLAQFNQVEQLINLNDAVNNMSLSQELVGAGLSNTLAASLTGKSVRVRTPNAVIGDGIDSSVRFNLENTASQVDITIRDENGSIIRTETLNNLAGGENSFAWDGRSSSGVTMPDGLYSVEISATNGDEGVGAYVFMEGIASRVRYTETGVQLQVNGLFVNLGAVEEIAN